MFGSSKIFYCIDGNAKPPTSLISNYTYIYVCQKYYLSFKRLQIMNTNTKFISLFGNYRYFTMRGFNAGLQTVRRSCCPSPCPTPCPTPCPVPSCPKQYEDLPPCPPKPWSGMQRLLWSLVSRAKKFPHVD